MIPLNLLINHHSILYTRNTHIPNTHISNSNTHIFTVVLPFDKWIHIFYNYLSTIVLQPLRFLVMLIETKLRILQHSFSLVALVATCIFTLVL